MRCGAKCFTVELESDGEKQTIPVIARTSVEARKAIRIEYGAEANILSVRQGKDKKWLLNYWSIEAILAEYIDYKCESYHYKSNDRQVNRMAKIIIVILY